MENETPRPVTDAFRVLLETCLRAAADQDDVRRSLITVNAWLGRELDRLPKPSRERSHGVLTPAARGHSGGAQPDPTPGGGDAAPAKRVTSRLSVVVTRARWKAAACRLSLDKRSQALAEGTEELAAQIEAREVSLRTRLSSLPDTGTWMLDLPFGRRISETDALDVDEEAAKKLDRVADCYDTLAAGAEIAMELDEGGAFQKTPPPAFLYLLAEAQSALLQSLAEAPTRSDSDQRDVFLWLKDQTTHYRIYVDRFMRLDDPADPSGSKDLLERMRRSSREILAQVKGRRERGQLVAKVRYHISKLRGEGPLSAGEVESLRHALDEWVKRGLERNDRGLTDVLDPLRSRVESPDSETEKALGKILDAFPTRDGRTGGRSEDEGQADNRSTGSSPRPVESQSSDGAGRDGAAKGDVSPEEARRPEELLAEVQELLSGREVTLFMGPTDELDVARLGVELGAGTFSAVVIDTTQDEEARAAKLQEQLGLDTELFLLGIRLDPEEYQTFKQGCISRDKQFVRLPGSLDAQAIAHQVSRQVGWRLRAQSDSRR